MQCTRACHDGCGEIGSGTNIRASCQVVTEKLRCSSLTIGALSEGRRGVPCAAVERIGPEAVVLAGGGAAAIVCGRSGGVGLLVSDAQG